MKLKKTGVAAVALCGVVALSTIGMGFAKWQTNITATGNVTASGSWNVEITAADVNLSTGSKTEKEVSNFELQRTNKKSDAYIASVISGPQTNDPSLAGTQCESPMSKYTYYYLIDTTKYDLSDEGIKALTTDKAAEIASDESTVDVANYLNMYYRSTAEKVVDGLIRDCNSLIKKLKPETYKNYTLAYISKYLPNTQTATFASMSEVKSTQTVEGGKSEGTISDDKSSASFGNVKLGLPGAWAEYTVTVSNKGTVDANLANAEITLNSESNQLVLDKPELSDEVLKPGETCTITVVVKVPDTITDDLNADAALTISLPYTQTVVEDAPTASHTNA